jgi:membrane-associated phospholipid phosphatase
MQKRSTFLLWLIPCFSFLALLLAIRLREGKLESFLLLQQNAAFPFDAWKLITHLGDGIFAAALVVFLLIQKNRDLALKLLLTWVIGAGIAQGLKNTVYAHRIRPVEWFKQKNLTLKVPDGHEPHRTHSFPSGHTATAFGVWGMMAYCSRRKWHALGFAALTILAAWSRIALFQHFPADVVAGGIIGTCSIFAAIWLARLLEQNFPQLRDNL